MLLDLLCTGRCGCAVRTNVELRLIGIVDKQAGRRMGAAVPFSYRVANSGGVPNRPPAVGICSKKELPNGSKFLTVSLLCSEETLH